MDEVELKYVPESEENKNQSDHFADTKEPCFLCLVNISNCSNNQKIAIWRICRYLKTNLPDIISKAPELGKNPLFVSVCTECKSISENLSNFLEQLELLQLKVDNILEQFTGILMGSGKNIHNLPSASSPGDPVNKKLAERLKDHLSKKCTERPMTVAPTVPANDNLSKQAEPVNEPGFIPPSAVFDIPISTLHSVFLSGLSKPSSSKLIEPPTKWKCNECHNSYSERRNLNRHRREKHKISLPFAAAKIRSDLSEKDFNDYCDHLFQTEIQTSQKIVEESEKKKRKIKCNHCQKILRDGRDLKCHLIAAHKKIMMKKLIHLQKTVGLDQLREKSKVRVVSKGNNNEDEDEQEMDHNYFEQSDVFVTKIDVSEEIDNCGEIGNIEEEDESQDFEMQDMMTDQDPLQI